MVVDSWRPLAPRALTLACTRCPLPAGPAPASLAQEVFDFPALKAFMSRKDFGFAFDALHAVTGAYAKPLFVE